ncbi:MAG: arginine deiminase-related protein [Bdellovibrionia bacterium]
MTNPRGFPLRVLMVSPDGFDVKYSINPHMTDADGKLKKIDHARARVQWGAVGRTYERLGYEVEVLPADPSFPDMVFCANQTFPYKDPGGTKCVLMSRMFAQERKGEVGRFREWFTEQGYKVFDLESKGDLEGAGDLLWDHEGARVFAGHGYRTSSEILDEVERLIQAPLIRLELRDPRYYHLDTCLTVLTSKRAAFVREAFTGEGVAAIHAAFDDAFEIDAVEAETLLAGNGHSPNGRDVILQSGCLKTAAAFRERGFQVHECDTSEFIKSGGSVFCMKQMIF